MSGFRQPKTVSRTRLEYLTELAYLCERSVRNESQVPALITWHDVRLFVLRNSGDASIERIEVVETIRQQLSHRAAHAEIDIEVEPGDAVYFDNENNLWRKAKP